MKNFNKISFILFLILIGAVTRFFPHAPNFTAIGAMALFGGTYLSKKTALILPILAMAISDAFLGFYDLRIMAFVYGSFLICVFMGFFLKKNKKFYSILTASFLSAFIFFILTNFAVFIFTPWYEKTLSGLIQCYIMALPFLKNNLLGDIFYTGVFFGSFEIASFFVTKRIKASEALIDDKLRYKI